MNRSLIASIVSGIVLVSLQILLFRNFAFFNLGFAFVYLLFMLSLPKELGYLGAMFLALAIGLVIDLFYQTVGIHAAALVFLMFVRPFWLSVNVPRSGYEVNDLMVLGNNGLAWFIGYSLPLVFVYCCIVFFVEAGNSELFWHTITKALVSTVITLAFIIIAQYLFYPKRR